jgi:hypothetical protein
MSSSEINDTAGLDIVGVGTFLAAAEDSPKEGSPKASVGLDMAVVRGKLVVGHRRAIQLEDSIVAANSIQIDSSLVLESIVVVPSDSAIAAFDIVTELVVAS